MSPRTDLLSNWGSTDPRLFPGVESTSTQVVFDQSGQLKSVESILEYAPRSKAIVEYERAMPILEKEVGEQSLVFKDFLLRYADLVAQNDDYLSREKADQIRVRANKIDAVAVN